MSRICKETLSLVAMIAFLAWFLAASAWATFVQGKTAQEQEPML